MFIWGCNIKSTHRYRYQTGKEERSVNNKVSEIDFFRRKKMGEISKEVEFDVGLKTVSNILREVTEMDDFSKKAEKLEFYVQSMEEEMRKIDAFKRELPHCMYLLTDAIEILKEKKLQLKGTETPVMEEFISLKSYSERNRGAKGSMDITEKKSWMSSFHLWSTPVHYEKNFNTQIEDSVLQLGSIRYREEEGSGSGSQLNGCDFKNRGGAFVPYKKPSVVTVMKEDERVLPVDGLSLSIPVAETGSIGLNVKEDCGFAGTKLQQQQQKKQRRCWSPELHRRFVDALELLGGPQLATPKQIRELMKVEGLTNDEVKSHLQKFRLHIRKIPTSPAGLLDFSSFPQIRCKNFPRPMVAHSSSPQGPLPRGNGANKGGSASGGDSMEDEDDGKSESQNWKARVQNIVEKRL